MAKSFKIAFVSDIHIDFYISPKHSGYKLENRMSDYIDNTLKLPEADILIFAGDNSHYPAQNRLMLEMIAAKKMFKKIFITFGNHDLYLISKSQKEKFSLSVNKLAYAKQLYSEVDTVEFLDGQIVTIYGIKIGGTGMWYDFSYGINNFNYSKEAMYKVWKGTMTDATRIVGTNDLGVSGLSGGWGMYGIEKLQHYTFDPLKFFEKEKEKMLKIVDQCDVFVSHMGPVASPNTRTEISGIDNGFYYFDGKEYLMKENAPKLWIFGHTHDSINFKVNNTHLYCNPLGYDDENFESKVEVVDFYDLK